VANQKTLHHLLLDLGSGCAFEEPADEGNPQSIGNVSSQRLPHAPNDEKEAKESARAGGNQSRAAKVFVYPPHYGAKNAASIQRECWNEVEQSQEAVNEREILGYRQGWRDVHEQWF